MNVTVPLYDVFRDDLVRQFGPNSSTPRIYRWSAKLLLEFLTSKGWPLQSVNSQTWSFFLQWLTTQNLEAHSVKTASKGAQVFLRWAAAKHFCPYLNVAELGAIQIAPVPESFKQVLSPTQKSMIWQAIEETPEPYRCIFRMVALLDLSAHELCSAKTLGLKRVDNELRLHYLPRKGEEMYVVVPAIGTQYFREYFAAMKQRVPAGEQPEWLFQSVSNWRKPMPPDTVRYEFEKLRADIRMPSLTLGQVAKMGVGG